MKVKDKRLNTEKYIMLKNKVYGVYLSDIEHPEENKIERMFAAIEPYNIPAVMEIVGDTIEFPYDKELSDFFKRNSGMSINDCVLTAANLFGIDTDLVISKMREYVSYDYHRLLTEGLIDNERVNKISNLYLERNKEKNK